MNNDLILGFFLVIIYIVFFYILSIKIFSDYFLGRKNFALKKYIFFLFFKWGIFLITIFIPISFGKVEKLEFIKGNILGIFFSHVIIIIHYFLAFHKNQIYKK